jgi:hypothetical protein
MFAPSQNALDEASGCTDYQARVGLMDRLLKNKWFLFFGLPVAHFFTAG